MAVGKEVKMEVHHIADGDICWKKIIDVIREELLCKPEMLISICKPCHYTIHGKTLKEKNKK